MEKVGIHLSFESNGKTVFYLTVKGPTAQYEIGVFGDTLEEAAKKLQEEAELRWG